jgi:hypothetical protein
VSIDVEVEKSETSVTVIDLFSPADLHHASEIKTDSPVFFEHLGNSPFVSVTSAPLLFVRTMLALCRVTAVSAFRRN